MRLKFGGLPPERVRIRDFNFRDKAVAILTLEDGRQLQFQLMGTGATAMSDGSLVATIVLELKDITIAAMSLEELRSRISLVPDSICWLSHWQDAELQSQADINARRIADSFMDLADAHADDLRDVEQKFRRETLLHLEVKKILAESLELRLPELTVFAHGIAKNGQKVERQWFRPSEIIPLLDVQLEKRFGSLIPDVLAVTPLAHGGVLLIEVTVTNHIDDERLTRIRQKNVPALEIDLSPSGGLISRTELKNLVVHGLELKRWLHHPEIHLQTQTLENEVSAKVEAINEDEHEEQEYRMGILATPLQEIAQDFLSAVFADVEYDRAESLDHSMRDAIEQARNYVNTEAGKLAICCALTNTATCLRTAP